MKKRDYLSPTAVKTFYEDVDKFYCQYLSEIYVPRDPQTLPMAIGSAFDAHVKSFLHKAVYGDKHDARFDLNTLFEAQVEKHNRDKIKDHGAYAFKVYKESGALNDLLAELLKASSEPQFEIEISSVVCDNVCRKFEDMVLLGKPDVFYKNANGHFVILDWKVNGWFAKTAKSPNKGYIKLRSQFGVDSRDPMHKECTPYLYKGMLINSNMFLEEVDEDWATQLAMYGWILGEPVGSDFICCIDQLVCKPTDGFPVVRIAEHKCLISKAFQIETYLKAMNVWDICRTGHVFRSLSKEESDLKCKTLDEVQRMTLTQEPDPDFDSFIKKKYF